MSGWNTRSRDQRLVISTPDGNETIHDGENLEEAIKKVARNKGYGRFRVFIDDDEINDPSDLNLAIGQGLEAGAKIEIEPEDKAGDK